MYVESLDIRRLSRAAREKREDKGLSQKRLADEFGLSDNYIGLLERGEVAKLHQKKVEMILDFLGIALSDFLKTRTKSNRRDSMHQTTGRQYTGKEVQRLTEWVRFKNNLRIKLINNEELEGHLKWYDQCSVKLVSTQGEFVIPRHSIVYFVENPESGS